jgi:hypothetical protein
MVTVFLAKIVTIVTCISDFGRPPLFQKNNNTNAMKTTILYSVVLLTMLGIGLSCKKVIEEVKPPVVTKPGSSTQPTSTTPVATTPTADTAWLSAYPPGCQLVKTVYKPSATGRSSVLDMETIKLDDGQNVKISVLSTSYYKYDGQGRIVEVKDVLADSNFYWLYKFNYKETILTLETTFTSRKENKTDITPIDTMVLYPNGFIRHYRIGTIGPGRQYNQDGQLINKYGSTVTELANRYENGNLIWESAIQRLIYLNGVRTETTDQTVEYKYDLTHANLPVIYQYEGKLSRNLPIESNRYACCDFGGALVYRETLTYTFDERGRVKRRVRHGTGYNQWLIIPDVDGVGVTDYEYGNCP